MAKSKRPKPIECTGSDALLDGETCIPESCREGDKVKPTDECARYLNSDGKPDLPFCPPTRPPKKTRNSDRQKFPIGFTPPPVEDMVAGLQDASDVADRLCHSIRAHISAGIATGDAIQSRLVGSITSPLSEAIQQGMEVCQGVEECIKRETLAAIGCTQEYLLGLSIPEEEKYAILDEMSALFGNPQSFTPPVASVADLGSSAVIAGLPSASPVHGMHAASADTSAQSFTQIGDLQSRIFHISPTTITPYSTDGSQSASASIAANTVGSATGIKPLPVITAGSGGQIVTYPGDCLQYQIGSDGIPRPINLIPPGQTPNPPLCADGSPLPSVTGLPMLGDLGQSYSLAAHSPHPTPPTGSGPWAVLTPYTFPGGGPPGICFHPASAALNKQINDLIANCGKGSPIGGGGPVTASGNQCPQCGCVSVTVTPCPPCPPVKDCPPPVKCPPPKKCPKPTKCPPGQVWDVSLEQCVPKTTSNYCIYCSLETGEAYLTFPGEGPASPDDELMMCGQLEDLPSPIDVDCTKPFEDMPDVEIADVNFPPGSIWCSLATCDIIDELALTPPVFGGIAGTLVEAIVSPGFVFNALQITEELSGVPKIVTDIVLNIMGGMLKQAGETVAEWVGQSGCTSPSYLSFRAIDIILGFFEKYVSASFDELRIPIKYFEHALCPQLTLTVDEAQSAYLADEIDQNTLRCLVQANNKCWEPFTKSLAAARSRPIPNELTQLRRREIIDEDGYNKSMRALGYLDQNDVDNIFALSTQIPFVSDLLRFMVRDVDDAAIVNKFGMDTDFNVKWTGKTKEWSLQQGVEQDYAMRVWRAHWTIPSPGQLYEMYHRLRNLPAGDPSQVPLSDVVTALEQQDILPFWIPKLLAISFRPLTRVDAKRAFDLGAIDEDQLGNSFSDVGYSDSNRDILVQFTKRQKLDAERSSRYFRAVVEGRLNFDEATAYWSSRGFDDAMVTDLLTFAQSSLEMDRRGKCLSSYRQRFMRGEFDYTQSVALLTGLGLVPNQAIALASSWQCEFDASTHHDTARRTLGWYKRGLVTQLELQRRLTNLGYVPESVNLMIQQANAEIGDKNAAAEAKRLRAIEKQQRQQAAALARGARLAARAIKQAEAAAEKAAKQAAQVAKQLADEAEALDKAIESAIKVAVNHLGAAVDDARKETLKSIDDLVASYSVSNAEAIRIIRKAYEMTQKGNWSQAATTIDLLAPVLGPESLLGGE